MKKLVYTIAIILSFTPTVFAQFNLGMVNSNWSGIYGLYMNPANIADNRMRFCVDVTSINAGVDNNLGYLKNSGDLSDAISNGKTSNIFNYSNNNQFSLMAPYAQIHLPGLMVSINHNHSVALTAGIRGMNQFNNFDQSLYRTLSDPSYVPNSNIDLTSNHFNYTAHVWSEVGLTYGGVILDEYEHEIKVGATIRYLGGIGYLGLKGNNLDAHFRGGNDSLFVSHSDIEFASNILSTRDAILNGVSNHSILSEFFGTKDGMGIGGDIGVVYDYNPDFERDQYASKRLGVATDYSTNRYKLRISASVMDIGAITYRSSVNSNANVTGNGTVSGPDFSNNVHNFDDFRHYAVAHGFTADTSHQDTKVYMPTTLRLGADYHVASYWFYINATFIANLANRQNFGNSYYNQLTVTPRFDTRLFSVGVPITYSVLSSTVKAGVGLRFTGFFIGSDDMLALFANHQYGFNVYAGGFVPIGKRRPDGALVVPADEEPEPDMDHGGSEDTSAFVHPRKALDNTGTGLALAPVMTNEAPSAAFSASAYFYDTKKNYAKKEGY